MSFLFGGARPTGADTIKEFQRKVSSQARGMEREISRLDIKENQLAKELSKCASTNRLDVAKHKAVELVRLRAHRGRLYTVKGHMTGLAEQLHGVQSSQRIQETVAYTTRMLGYLNAGFNATAVHRMLMEFEKQNTLMTMKQEIIEETLDSAFETDGESAATDDAVLAVMQEAGLDLTLKMQSENRVPSTEDLDERLRHLTASQQR